MRGSPPRATYTFKHALIRDVAYGRLPKRLRSELHARCGIYTRAETVAWFLDKIGWTVEAELSANGSITVYAQCLAIG